MIKPFIGRQGSFLLCIAALLLLQGFNAKAGIGLRLSQARPYGDFKFVFKNAPSVELFYAESYGRKKRWEGRIGGGYSRFTPKLDTFSTYAVEDGFVPKVLPGYIIYGNMQMAYIFIDISGAVVKVNNFSLYAGVGMTVGLYKNEYERAIKGLINETSSTQDEMGGFRSRLSASYKLGDHFRISLEAMNHAIVSTTWDHFGHNTIGFGFIYFIDVPEIDNYY